MSTPDTARCPNCFGATRSTPCPHCGWRPGQDNPPPALALGQMLDGRYRIGRVLGHGGFGITYLAWDDNLQLRLAIKEYLPRDSATRSPDGISLAIYSGQAGEQFAYGLDRFLEEARALAHFDQHPGIVTVKNFFRAHGTGYCVMDYVEGITLRQYLEQQSGGRISVADALKLLMPVMDALRAVHKEGLLHRDLAPDNIYLTADGRIKLLDFGAARYAASEHSKSLSIILKPGYAPEEQYRTKGHQGPWTDVYGLAATFYRTITGKLPPESLDRLDTDELIPPSKLGIAIRPEQEAALLKGLAVKASQRFQSMDELQQALRTGAQLQPPQEHQGGKAKGPDPVAQPTAPPAEGDIGVSFPILGGMLILIGVLFLFGALNSIFSENTSDENVRSSTTLSGMATTTPQVNPSVPVTTPQAPVQQSPENITETFTEGEKAPLYFAAALGPTANIPPEAPLCYKFMVAGPEEQLRKLKAKYPGLYDYQITTNPTGGKNLVAKRRDETGIEITYFYSTSPEVCNNYQKDRLQTPAKPGDRGGSNTASPPGEALTPSGNDNSPKARYRFLGKDQGIVEDIRTKLQWQRCSLGQTWNGASCVGEATKYEWDQAHRTASVGWRLPTKEELASLVYCSSGEPAYWKPTTDWCEGAYGKPTIWITAFPNTPANWFWSSSPHASLPYSAWGVGFSSGGVYGDYNKYGVGYVRLVRSGQ